MNMLILYIDKFLRRSKLTDFVTGHCRLRRYLAKIGRRTAHSKVIGSNWVHLGIGNNTCPYRDKGVTTDLKGRSAQFI